MDVGTVGTPPVHDLADAMHVERVHRVLAEDVMAAPGDLLGQDRAAHQEDGDGVGRHAGDEQAGKQVPVVRQLDGEEHRRQGRAHRAAHHRGHADDRPETGIPVRQHRGRERSRARRPS